MKILTYFLLLIRRVTWTVVMGGKKTEIQHECCSQFKRGGHSFTTATQPLPLSLPPATEKTHGHVYCT
jgi:hypothetical protein